MEQFRRAAATGPLRTPLRPAAARRRQPRRSDSVDQAFGLDIGGEKIRVTGRIDRIDVGRAGDRTVFNVIDYKSGKRPTLTSEKLESGERLQPAVYVMAAEVLLFGETRRRRSGPATGRCRTASSTDARYSLQCSVDGIKPNEDWEELRPKVVERIGHFVADIRHGKFPVASRDHDCTSTCDFNTVCRIAQIRSLGKTWTPEIEPTD